MHGGQLRRVNRVERPEEIQFAVIVRRGVAEDGHLNVHAGIKPRISRIGTKFFRLIFPLDIHIVSMYRVPMIRKELVAASAEPLILSLLAKGESYGYAIIQEVKTRSDGKLNWTDGMLYPVLHRMEHRGLIKSRWAESETGRKRKYYSLKKDGKAAMAKHHEQWSLVHSVLAGLKKEQYV
jgi:PadR family transcriptional regulator PadR